MDDQLTALTELLRELPGIGPRAARRLAYWFVRRDRTWIDRFVRVLSDAHRTVRTCTSCMRMFPGREGMDRCSICTNEQRDKHLLLVVEKDVDLENIERTGAYKGFYFVLGGTVSALDKDPDHKIRINELEARLKGADHELTELILALSATTEGEETAFFIGDRVRSIADQRRITVTTLGRGLSTGTELEYVDTDTMTNALQGRK
jgi:recombination protein RecR